MSEVHAVGPLPWRDPDVCWQAILEKNERAAGQFLYGVATTRIYCRPGCPARRPKRVNVVFFDTAIAARSAGFRACKRCAPDDAYEHNGYHVAVHKACLEMARCVSGGETLPTLKELAALTGYSSHHFQRVFKSVVGISPRDYGRALRYREVWNKLTSSFSGNVTHTLFDCGYQSTSRFYEEAKRRGGMMPRSYKRGGAGLQMQYGIGLSCLGYILVAASERGIVSVRFGEGPDALLEDLNAVFPNADIREGGNSFKQTIDDVVAAISSPKAAQALPLDIVGTAFEEQVWSALRDIPFGETRTYSEVAAALGRPTAVRAVAKACAANPIAVLTPCHRVIRQDGSLSGYRWGIERKRALIDKERKVKK